MSQTAAFGQTGQRDDSLHLSLTVMMQGFYNPSEGKMIPDSVQVLLFSSSNYQTPLSSRFVWLDSDGHAIVHFPQMSTGYYYIAVKHRNSIETWSKNTVQLLTGNTIAYDFTTDSSKAYGDNEILVGDRWCIFSGDVNQDGYIDEIDLAEVDTAYSNYVTGYVPEDVNGDGYVDGTDVSIVDNNKMAFAGVFRPGYMKIDVTGFIEGFYNISTGYQIPDFAKMYIHQASSPYSKADSSKVYFDRYGHAKAVFTHSSPGQYYLVYTHRNSLETWSKYAIQFQEGTTINYNFSDSASKAYGDNLKLVGTKYCFYSGDVNQDGYIDEIDLAEVDTANTNFVVGYVPEDVNGDGFVDGSDVSMVDNNKIVFASVFRPGYMKIDVTGFIEGFYNTSTGYQVPDFAKMYIHQTSSPYSSADTSKVYFDSYGHAKAVFTHASPGQYYLVYTHRNSLETWSKNPLQFQAGKTINYDFSDSASKAYGDNLKLVGTKYCFYSGDVNQDGYIDEIDLAEVDTAYSNYVTGYVPEDVNGDGYVDGTDVSMVDNNKMVFASVFRPGYMKIDVTGFIEGFYNTSTGYQVPDFAKMYIHQTSSPYSSADTSKVYFDSYGHAKAVFTHASPGQYYLVYTHRNSLETWSKNPLQFQAGKTINYDFSDSASKAYGDNLKLVGNKYCFFSGDVNQDGYIDEIDLAEVDTANTNFVVGYVPEDVNGSGFVDGSDVSMVDNNKIVFASVFRPGYMKIDVTGFIEGFYNTSTGYQVPDFAKMYIHHTSSPYSSADSSNVYFDSYGHAKAVFTHASPGQYYLVYTHRNSLQTWSKNPMQFQAGTTINYTFSDSASKAYGDNLKLVGTKYCFYSGDVNQDGLINDKDSELIDIAANDNKEGYVPEDLNNDLFVDFSDQSIISSNLPLGISLIRPIAKKSAVAVNTNENILPPTSFQVSQNYPNPFNPSTRIQFQIPKDGWVTLKVYNTLGQLIKTIANEMLPQGYYSYYFDGSMLSSGIYIYRIQYERHNFIGKMILQK